MSLEKYCYVGIYAEILVTKLTSSRVQATKPEQSVRIVQPLGSNPQLGHC